MLDVVGVVLKGKGHIYYFSPAKFTLKKKLTVIVETERGLQFGTVSTDIFQIAEEKLKFPLKAVVRIASREDYEQNKKNINDAKKALLKCQSCAQKFNLDMKIIDASYTFDRDKLVFEFVADKRIDFRDLAKDLANIYRTRIELRQIGVRDKAREIGGIGSCGRKFCCSKFLNDFDAVSINMAKNQNLSLNPTKINGVCGRLLCCLNFENECYEECRKGLPKIGKKVKTSKGEGTVISVNILKQTYRVDIPNMGIIEENLKNES